MRRTLFCVVVSLLLSAAAVGQAGAPGAPPSQPTAGEAVQPAPPMAGAADAQSGPLPVYLLQPGDELEVRVYNLPELTAAVAVRPDGKISVPLQNDLNAAGLSAAQLTEAITAGYEKEFRNPRVTVIVKTFSGENVYIGGEVTNAGFIPLKGKLTVLQAVFRAGGFKESAKVDSVMLLRNEGSGKPSVTRLQLGDVLHGKPDLPLQAYDVVYVPKSKIARADKFVEQYIRQLLPITLSGGFSYILGQTVAVH